MKSNNCCLIRLCDTWTTALQNSNEFMKDVSFGISATSSGVMRYQSLDNTSNEFGNDEYSPPKPVTNTGHIDEYWAMYVPTLEFFCDSAMHSNRASLAWWPNEPSRCTYGINSENIMKLNKRKWGSLIIILSIQRNGSYSYLSYLVASVPGLCCDDEKKNKSSRWTFCISTTHSWLSKMTKRFSTSVGNISPWLEASILSNGFRNGSCTSNSWWRECVTNCSYNFNCSRRTALAYLED